MWHDRSSPVFDLNYYVEEISDWPAGYFRIARPSGGSLEKKEIASMRLYYVDSLQPRPNRIPGTFYERF